MAIINQATKELQVKIVYYVPALGGKTTNLVQVHDHVQTTMGYVKIAEDLGCHPENGASSPACLQRVRA